MHGWIVAVLLFFGAPFWERKPPADWSSQELEQMITDSPWGQAVGPLRTFPGAAPVAVFFATAKPVRLAEEEARRRGRKPGDEENPSEAEYRQFLEQDAGRSIVIAVQVRDRRVLTEGEEMGRAEHESVMKVGKRKYHAKMQFSPGERDRFLRLVFPRDVRPEDKHVDVELYVPGEPAPYREVTFDLKDMKFQGKLEL